jgi:hypothetical protein
MSDAPRLLVDVRESDYHRGFHALAALYLMADRLGSTPIYCLGGEGPNERIAYEAFAFDTGLHLRPCEPALAPEERFDVYLAASDVLPWDDRSVSARGAARRTVAALMFGLREFQPAFAGVVVVGHDTGAIAAKVLSELRLADTAQPRTS